MLLGHFARSGPWPRLSLDWQSAVLVSITILVCTASLTVPASSTLASRAKTASLGPDEAVDLPERIVAPIPPLNEAAETFDPSALVRLPGAVQGAAERLAAAADMQLAPARAQQERERQEALRRQTQLRGQAAHRAIAVAQGNGPVKLSSPIGADERWIDVNLSAQTVIAMIGSELAHVALTTTGAPGWETPTGEFRILRRVYNETMTSASLGIPADREYYHLENVLFTQYFTNEGHALHLNYWRPDSYFGNIPSSHGCAGLRYADAAYFWEFARIGTRIVIHY